MDFTVAELGDLVGEPGKAGHESRWFAFHFELDNGYHDTELHSDIERTAPSPSFSTEGTPLL